LSLSDRRSNSGFFDLRRDPPPALQTSPRPIISRAMPTIDLPDDELAAVTAAIRRAIEDDKFPHAPRLDPLRAALARLEAATGGKKQEVSRGDISETDGPAASQRQAGAAISSGRALQKSECAVASLSRIRNE
jgi:hypothetical protein